MIGGLGLHPILVTVASGIIDARLVAEAFTSRLIVNGQGGASDDIDQILSEKVPGMMVVIQGIVGQVLTIKNLAKGGGDEDIRTPRAVDFTLDGEENVTLIYDAINNEWAFMDGAIAADANQWSLFPAVSDIDFALFDGINIDRLRFVFDSGAPVTSSDVTILKDSAGNMQFNVAATDSFIHTINDVDSVRHNPSDSQFINPVGAYILEIRNEDAGIIDLEQIGELRFTAFDTQSASAKTYARILVNADDVNPTASLDARMTFLLMRAGTVETFMAFNTTGNNNIDIFKLVDFNNNELRNTAGIFPQDNGLDDIGTLTQSYNQVFIDGLHFVHSTTSVAGERMISFEPGGDMEYNVPDADLHVLRFQAVDKYLFSKTLFQLKNLIQIQFLDASDNQDIKINYQDPVLLFDLSGSASAVVFDNNATIPNFILRGGNTADNLLAHALLFQGLSSTSVLREYGSVKVRQEETLNGVEDARMELAVIENGVADVEYFRCDASVGIRRNVSFKEIDMSSNKILGLPGTFISDLTTVTAVAGDFVMIRDLTDSALKKVDVNDFLGGGGPPFDDNQVIIQDDIDNTKTLTFNLSLVSASDAMLISFSATASRTYTFPDITGTVILSAGNQTIGGTKTFTGFVDLQGNVDLGNASGDLISFEGRVDTDLLPNIDAVRNLGSTSLRWGGVISQQITFATGMVIRDSAGTMLIQSPVSGDIRISEGGSVDWVTFDATKNVSRFERDITLTSGEAIRADGTGEIGYFVSNQSANPGSEGSIELPFSTSATPSDATLNSLFGNFDGAIGVSGASAGTPRLQIKVNNNWNHVNLTNSN